MRLRPYQERLATALYESDSCLVSVPMGAGKTVTVATALQELLNDGHVKHALIVAPLRVARITWPEELDKWDHLTMSYRVITGAAAQREAALKAPADVTLVHYEVLPWLLERDVDVDLIVLDEVTRLKNSTGVRSKALTRYARDRTLIRWGMTGTMVTQGLRDLHGICKALDGGRHLGSSKTRFMQEYYRPKWPGAEHWNVVPREGALDDVLDKISDMVVQISDDEYSKQLPDLLEIPIFVQLPDDLRPMYREMEQQLISELADGTTVVAASAGVAVNKLQQLANGFIYHDDGSATQLHTQKLDAFMELVASAGGDNLLVMYRYQNDLAAMQSAVPGPNLGDSDDSMVARWNAGEIPVMYAHPGSCGHGLNLQYGGHHIVWFTMPWSLEEYLQSIARLLRADQPYPVICYNIAAINTVDQDVADALMAKDRTLQAVKDGLLNRSEEVMK